ncbi:MAG: hypothetical protein IJ486_09685 [Firmicutes bacterium]|nr:hypothetical protein [Bacillota bacterium]
MNKYSHGIVFSWGITDDAVEYLSEYSWPGNVRELEHVLERACVLKNEAMLDRDMFLFLEKKKKHKHTKNISQSFLNDNFFLKKGLAEKELIIEALKKSSGNKTQAAALMGISRSLLCSKIKKYNIEEVFMLDNE